MRNSSHSFLGFRSQVVDSKLSKYPPVAIHSVHVASHEAEFIHVDPLTNITVGPANDPPDIHRHPELKRKVYSALQEGDEGELSIAIPKEVSFKVTGTFGTAHSECEHARHLSLEIALTHVI